MSQQRVRSGKLRHVVELHTLSQVPDGVGGQPGTYSLFATVFASIDQVSESEKLNAGMLHNVITHKIRIRFCDGLTDSDQVRFGPTPRIFEIVSIENVQERNYVMDLMCLERSPT